MAVAAAVALSSFLVVHFQSASRSSAPTDKAPQTNAAEQARAGEPAASGSADPSGSAAAAVGPAPRSSSARPPASSSGFPDASNTGVPAGTKLATYSGPCTITADGAVIDSKTVNCDPLEVKAKKVVISKTKINGILVTDQGSDYSFTLQDSEVDGGTNQRTTVGSTNMTILRANIHGGQHNVTCYANCNIRDSFLHTPSLPAGADWHLGPFLANDTGPGGKTNAVLVHNTLACDTPANNSGGGCSGNVNLFADFGPVSFVTVDNNLLVASPDISYCVYGGSSNKAYTSGVSNIVFTGNVFRRGGTKKCGYYGPVTSFDRSRPGNRWENNVWEDGQPVESAN